MTKNRPHLSHCSRVGGLLSRSLEIHGASHRSLENASLAPRPAMTHFIFAHGTTILTNREPSEHVGECILYALQVRTRTI